MQKASDLTAADLRKNQLFKIPPYVDYVKLCHDVEIKTWKDMLKFIDMDVSITCLLLNTALNEVPTAR